MRNPGDYDGPLGRRLRRQGERVTVPVSELQAGDRLVEFDGHLSVRSVTSADDGKVDVCFGDVTWDLSPDLRVEVWR